MQEVNERLDELMEKELSARKKRELQGFASRFYRKLGKAETISEAKACLALINYFERQLAECKN